MTSPRPLQTLLVANRGEIACRIICTARRMGMRTVAICSEADTRARHALMADAAVAIGAAPAPDSYLNIDRIIEACRASRADAVHPGYGFLAESAQFARACRDAGLTFVGPAPEAIEALGNKSRAKHLARGAGVPCVPGYDGDDQSLETLVGQARAIEMPVMIKAAAGGGGRGMRACRDPRDEAATRALLEAARREAQAAFGDPTLLLEALVENARHVEVQIFGDSHGNRVHLGDRDCSSQRRHQKILEESPAPGLAPATRAAICEAAVSIARAADYVGAGTVEFLVRPDGQYYFLEVNTRLQVEHPVTEAITGLDLVEWQLRVARGESLPRTQEEIAFHGHAIEARLCAEDPDQGFAPQSGTLSGIRFPAAHLSRVDHGLGEPATVSPHYDSLIAKLIAHGTDREHARSKLLAALSEFSITGIVTNRDYLADCLRAPEFATATLSTAWLEAWTAKRERVVPGSRWWALAAASIALRGGASHGALAGWSSTVPRRSTRSFRANGEVVKLQVECRHELAIGVWGDGWHHEIASPQGGSWRERVSVDGVATQVALVHDACGGWLDAFGHSARFDDVTLARATGPANAGDAQVRATMHGRICEISVGPGDAVSPRQRLLSIEAMKMEHHVHASLAGVVREVAVRPGEQVVPGHLLVVIDRGEAGGE